MHELELEITEQMGVAAAALAAALADGDDYLAGIYEAELDDLAQTACAHGLVIDLRRAEPAGPGGPALLRALPTAC